MKNQKDQILEFSFCWFLFSVKFISETIRYRGSPYLILEIVNQDKCPKYNGSSILLCHNTLLCSAIYCVKQNSVSTRIWQYLTWCWLPLTIDSQPQSILLSPSIYYPNYSLLGEISTFLTYNISLKSLCTQLLLYFKWAFLKTASLFITISGFTYCRVRH
jgi:hypothetical protein